MILLLHILIALASLAFTTYLFISPTKNKFYVNYGFIAATMASGTYLVVTMDSNILGPCVTGLAYLAIVTAGTVAAQYKLARTHI